MKERADRVLVARGLAETAEKAAAMIMAGEVFSGERRILKAGEPVAADIPMRIEAGIPYVSRGGLKLAEALDRFGVDPNGKTAVDIGSSTGGFTDCLLQRGAARVYAVDVDIKQLASRVRASERVTTVEKNARNLAPGDIPERPDLFTMDVSFISVTKIFPALAAFPGGWQLVSLIKPQFEAERDEVGKKGIVRDPAVHAAVLERVIGAAEALGFRTLGVIKCSTRGQKGNVEFFARLVRGGQGPAVGGAKPFGELIKEAMNDEER